MNNITIQDAVNYVKNGGYCTAEFTKAMLPFTGKTVKDLNNLEDKRISVMVEIVNPVFRKAAALGLIRALDNGIFTVYAKA